MADSSGKGIARLYLTGGTDLLAHRLANLFTKIENDEDRALHNDVVSEVLEMINTEPPSDVLTIGEWKFLRRIAEYLLYRRLDDEQIEELTAEKHKRFLFRMAEYVINVASMKGH